jgi:hypothetical protein
LKRAEAFAFRLCQFLLQDGIHAASAGAFLQGLMEIGEVRRVTAGHDFDMAVFGIPNPAAQFKLGRFAMDKPTEADALDAAFD